jgi:hypothetical protein
VEKVVEEEKVGVAPPIELARFVVIEMVAKEEVEVQVVAVAALVDMVEVEVEGHLPFLCGVDQVVV